MKAIHGSKGLHGHKVRFGTRKEKNSLGPAKIHHGSDARAESTEKL